MRDQCSQLEKSRVEMEERLCKSMNLRAQARDLDMNLSNQHLQDLDERVKRLESLNVQVTSTCETVNRNLVGLDSQLRTRVTELASGVQSMNLQVDVLRSDVANAQVGVAGIIGAFANGWGREPPQVVFQATPNAPSDCANAIKK